MILSSANTRASTLPDAHIRESHAALNQSKLCVRRRNVALSQKEPTPGLADYRVCRDLGGKPPPSLPCRNWFGRQAGSGSVAANKILSNWIKHAGHTVANAGKVSNADLFESVRIIQSKTRKNVIFH